MQLTLALGTVDVGHEAPPPASFPELCLNDFAAFQRPSSDVCRAHVFASESEV